MTSRDATQPERVLAVYRRDRLVAVLRESGGAVVGASNLPLLEHRSYSGRIRVLEEESAVLSAITASRTRAELLAGLEAVNLKLVVTPASALHWAM